MIMKDYTMNLKQMEKMIENQLEYETLEEFLEHFDITPLDVVLLLFAEGLIDEESLKRMTPLDGEF